MFFRWDAVEQGRGFGSLDGSFAGDGVWGVVVEGSDDVKLLGDDEVGAVFAAQGISRKNMGAVYYVVHVPGTIDPATGEREILPRYRIKTFLRGKSGIPEDTRILTHYTDGKLKLHLHKMRRDHGVHVDHRDPNNLKWKLSRWDITVEGYKRVLERAKLGKGTERMRQEAPPQGAEYTMREVPRGQKQKRLRQGRPAPTRGAVDPGREVTPLELERAAKKREKADKESAKQRRQEEAEAAESYGERRQLQIQNIEAAIASLTSRKEYAEEQIMQGVRVDHWTTQRDRFLDAIATEEGKLPRGED